MKLGINTLVLLAVVASCKNTDPDHDRMRAENARMHADWFQRMQHATIPAAERIRADARFECIWSGLQHANKDPVPELECFFRRSRAGTECLLASSADRISDECENAATRACPESPEFMRTSDACSVHHP